jgi:hypothetical protein
MTVERTWQMPFVVSDHFGPRARPVPDTAWAWQAAIMTGPVSKDDDAGGELVSGPPDTRQFTVETAGA